MLKVLLMLQATKASVVTHTAFLQAILKGDRGRAIEEALRQSERGLPHLYDAIIAPALREIGELWLSNRLSVAEEHLATAIAQSAMGAVYPHVHWPPVRGPDVLVACVEGERHEIGARMVADLLAMDGWRERFFGSDTPIDSLAAKARELRAPLIALSVTLPQSVRHARQCVEAVREASPSSHILIGGPGVSREEADRLGADSYASSASHAVEVAQAWKRENASSSWTPSSPTPMASP
jgi:methanogenic corrinoid protein MtbC1